MKQVTRSSVRVSLKGKALGRVKKYAVELITCCTQSKRRFAS